MFGSCYGLACMARALPGVGCASLFFLQAMHSAAMDAQALIMEVHGRALRLTAAHSGIHSRAFRKLPGF